MTNVGKDVFEVFKISQSLDDSSKHEKMSDSEIFDFGMQIVSQLEILHKLGYTHGDLKFQNICFDEHTKRFTLIDFALATKIFHKNGEHQRQKKVSHFYGNPLFASDDMIQMKTPGRKDDLESLIYILCFMRDGMVPTIEFVNIHIDSIQMP